MHPERQGPHDLDAVPGLQACLEQLHAATWADHRDENPQGAQGHRAQQLVGDPREDHLLAPGLAFEGPDEERSGGAAVLGAGIPGPASEVGGGEELPRGLRVKPTGRDEDSVWQGGDPSAGGRIRSDRANPFARLNSNTYG